MRKQSIYRVEISDLYRYLHRPVRDAPLPRPYAARRAVFHAQKPGREELARRQHRGPAGAELRRNCRGHPPEAGGHPAVLRARIFGLDHGSSTGDSTPGRSRKAGGKDAGAVELSTMGPDPAEEKLTLLEKDIPYPPSGW